MRIHFSALRGINRTAWGTKLLHTAILTSFVDCISLYHILKAQHCSLGPNGFFNPPTAPTHSHPLPLPIEAIQILTLLNIFIMWYSAKTCATQNKICRYTYIHYACMTYVIHACINIYVTRSRKTGLNRTFCISRNTYLKYSMHCPSLVVQYGHTRYVYYIYVATYIATSYWNAAGFIAFQLCQIKTGR